MSDISNKTDSVISTSAGEFAVRDFGGIGPDIVLIHGTGHNLEVWGPAAALLRERFHVVAFDMRGHGQTPVDSTDSEEYWKDIGVIIKALNLQSPVLVGHSTGGYAVTAYAAFGGDCSAVVIADGFVLDDRKSPEGSHAWDIPEQQLWDMFRYGWVADQDAMEQYITEVCAHAATDWLNKGVAPELIAAFTRRSFFRKGDQWLRRPTMDELKIVGKPDPARSIYPSVDVYDRVHVPIGFIFAGDGLYKGRGHEVQAVAALSKNRIFSEVDCGHNLHMLYPNKIREIIESLSLLFNPF
ncbi:MAG: alpha/beta hydrolase [Candidatus Omnitrophica bacterium]|nr:alpha/beta hydrolase [Candidatus Omnitrophota bacterium]